ncbi:MAG: hypothetical protein L0Y61_09300, partial [Epsilonproteobacteria bacterium]|nr:hypothetical protein [Campylobacterota bacterium]
QKHPILPLYIWNYSKKTQYENLWDYVTLQCRGLVTDDKGNIIAKSFKKFFNIEEGRHTPTNDFQLYEKMDGSLIIAFFYQGWQVASKGSFTSDQAILATELFSKLNHNSFSIDGTYCFELIGPSNRIVVKYPEDKLVLLTIFWEGDNGFIELPREVISLHSQLSGCDLVPTYDFKDFATIKALNWDNHEGFVARFSNGERCKIKFENYIVLHGIITNCSSYVVWEYLRTIGKIPEEMLKEVPDEFYEWIKDLSNKLSIDYLKFLYEAYKDFDDLIFWHGNKSYSMVQRC